eukprot:4304579-Amphidinium_carterae.1
MNGVERNQKTSIRNGVLVRKERFPECLLNPSRGHNKRKAETLKTSTTSPQEAHTRRVGWVSGCCKMFHRLCVPCDAALSM